MTKLGGGALRIIVIGEISSSVPTVSNSPEGSSFKGHTCFLDLASELPICLGNLAARPAL